MSRVPPRRGRGSSQPANAARRADLLELARAHAPPGRGPPPSRPTSRAHLHGPQRAQTRTGVRGPSTWWATSSASSRRRARTAATRSPAGSDEPRQEAERQPADRARRRGGRARCRGRRRGGRGRRGRRGRVRRGRRGRRRRGSRRGGGRRRGDRGRDKGRGGRRGRRGGAEEVALRKARAEVAADEAEEAADEAKEAAETAAKPKRSRAKKAAAVAPETKAEDEAGADEPVAETAADEPAEAVSEEPVAEPAEAVSDEAAETPAPAPTRRRDQRRELPAGVTVRAQAKYVRTSARKARLVCEHIRGKDVDEARAILALHAARSPRRTGPSCSSPRSRTRSTTTSWWARTCASPPVRRRGADAQALPAARDGPRHAHSQADLAPDDHAHPEGALEHGAEGTSRSHARGVHPRLEVELVQRAPLLRLPDRGRAHPPTTSPASWRTPASRTSRSARTPPRSR